MRGTGPCPQAPEPGGPQGTLGRGTVRVRRETRQVEWYTHHLALEITCSDVVGGPVGSPQIPPRLPRAKPQQEPLPHPFGVFISVQLISLAQSCRTLQTHGLQHARRVHAFILLLTQSIILQVLQLYMHGVITCKLLFLTF